MSQPLIDLVNISKSFDGTMVLDDLNLSVKENSFVTLLGPSGCGKTTTLRILGGFEHADSGKVIFDGQDISSLPPNKRQLNTVFQKYALFPHLNVADNIGFAIVDRMLGGTGTPLDKSRDFTEIELVILERIIEVCTNLLVDPWESVVAVEPRLERIETNSQFAQFISPSEMTAIVTMNIKIGDTEGLMNICIPFSCVEPVIDKLNTKYWFSTMKKDDSTDYEEQIESLIKRVDAPIRAVLGKSQVSVNDFLGLQCGDIIRLDTNVNSEMSVYVGNIRKFTALPGSSQDKYAVRITSVIREGE